MAKQLSWTAGNKATRPRAPKSGSEPWRELVELLFSGRAPTGITVSTDLPLAGLRLRALPADLHVRGDLDLRQSERLHRIGDGLRVEGSLTIGGRCKDPRWPRELPPELHARDPLTPLEELPENLEVAEDLTLRGCHRLRRLPAKMRVGRSLRIFGCRSLEALPKGLQVSGDLEIGGRNDLLELPAGLRVGGDLRIQGGLLGSLPETLQVKGRLELLACRHLERLPRQLAVGALRVRGASALTALPNTLHCERLRLEHLPGLEALPRTLRCEHLAVKRCPIVQVPLQRFTSLVLEHLEIDELPEKLEVRERLVLTGLPLKRLPARLAPTTELRIDDCPLEELPGPLRSEQVRLRGLPLSELPPMGERGAFLEIERCHELREVTAPPRVQRVEIRNCRQVGEVPESIGYSLVLRGLPALGALPEKLAWANQWSQLIIADCPALQELPAKLRCGSLHLSRPTALRSLPKRLVEAAYISWQGFEVPRRELLDVLDRHDDLPGFFHRLEQQNILRVCREGLAKVIADGELYDPTGERLWSAAKLDLSRLQRVLWRHAEGWSSWNFIASLKRSESLGMAVFLEGRWRWVEGDRESILATVPDKLFAEAIEAIANAEAGAPRSPLGPR